MILDSRGRYTSIYDEAEHQVIMCMLPEGMKLFADHLDGEDSAFVIVDLKNGDVNGSDKDKRTITTFLMDGKDTGDATMSDDAFLQAWANIDYGHATHKTVECIDNSFTLDQFEQDLQNAKTDQDYYEILQRRMARND